MTEKRQPWMKWYPADWRADPRLRMCSLAARGLWIDLISYMHEGEPYGHLLIDGAVPAPEDIASLVGRPIAEVRKALTELEARGVLSRSGNGVIFSRRMVRDRERSHVGREEVRDRWGQSDGLTRSQRLAASRKKGTHTPEQFAAMVDVFEGKCVRCGKEGDILRDHIVPLYQGGSDGLENLQPLCATCNRAKGPENIDYRENVKIDWRERLEKRLGQRLGNITKTSTQKLDARSQKPESKQAAREDDPKPLARPRDPEDEAAIKLGTMALRIIGKLDDPTWTFGEAYVWRRIGRESGLDDGGIERIVEAEIRRMTAGKSTTARSLKYFTPAITEGMLMRIDPFLDRTGAPPDEYQAEADRRWPARPDYARNAAAQWRAEAGGKPIKWLDWMGEHPGPYRARTAA